MTPIELDNYINQKIEQKLNAFQKDILYTVKNASFHFHNGTDSPILPPLSYIMIGQGTPTATAKEGTLYINTTASSATTRFYIMTASGTTWAYFTASS